MSSPAGRQWEGPVVIVDPYSSGAQLAPAFAVRGVPVHAVVTADYPPEVYAASYRPEHFASVIVDRGDRDALVDHLRGLRPRCVIAGCESGVELAESLAPEVTPQVCNVPELAQARRHKGAMAQAVTAAGLPGIRQITTNSADDVSAWLHESGLVGRTLVIKPPMSASTDGVTKVSADTPWLPVFESLLGSTNRLGLVNDKVVVQEYVQGVEYVVDTFSFDGEHSVTDVCRYTKRNDGAGIAVYDAMEWVSPDDEGVPGVVTYALAVLDAVGMRFGAAHLEVMATDCGPLLIELGARAHGGGQPRYCLMATGDSQVERTASYFSGNQKNIPLSYELRRHALVVFHMTRTSGTVIDLAALAALDDLPTKVEAVNHFKVGMRLCPTTDLFSSLDLGFVVLCGTDREQIWRDYARVREVEQRLICTDLLEGV